MGYEYINDDRFNWMNYRDANSISAIVTDPPYGAKKYADLEIEKSRDGKGGIWRLPPAFDGHSRQAVPRFSVINDDPQERENVYLFFNNWAQKASRILMPGGHIFIASAPL